MRQISGHSYITVYHPEIDGDCCEMKVKWTHSYDPGDYYDPPCEKMDIDDVKVVAYNNKPITKPMAVPDWVTDDELMDGIDIFNDGYDGDNN
jgi:hypothetical protein